MNAELRLQGAPNFRDLGGYVNADGKRVKHRLLYRSEGLHQLTAEDHAVLHDLGLKLICDLRSDFEREKKPTVWPEHMLPETLIMDVNADIRAEVLGQRFGNKTIHVQHHRACTMLGRILA